MLTNSGSIDLVPLSPENDAHAEMFQTTRNDPRMHTEGEAHTPKILAEARDEITDMRERDSSVLVCAIQAEDALVGWVTLDMVGHCTRTGIIAYYVLPGFQGNGYATEAGSLCTKAAFVRWNAHKVRASVRDDNPASTRVLEKLGFQCEGRLRDATFANGEYVDMLRWGLLENEFSRINGI